MIKVGITGSFGAGKTLVAGMFKARGASVIDADALAHGLLKNDAACIRAIRKVFGSGVVGKSGVDRAKLGKIVFDDPQALKALEAVVHPRLERLIIQAIRKARSRVVVLDAAILIEAGWHTMMDTVVLVKARSDVQLRRVTARTGLSRADVLKRIRRQMPLGKKRKFADHIIDNSGAAAITEKHVERIFRSLTTPPIHEESVS